MLGPCTFKNCYELLVEKWRKDIYLFVIMYYKRCDFFCVKSKQKLINLYELYQKSAGVRFEYAGVHW